MLALHAGLFVHLYRRFGGSEYAFVQRFFKAASQMSSRYVKRFAGYSNCKDDAANCMLVSGLTAAQRACRQLCRTASHAFAKTCTCCSMRALAPATRHSPPIT
jgi:hypothetical protein